MIGPMYYLREAIASVSLSHRPSCRCRCCRASLGDEEAFAQLLSALLDPAEEDNIESGLQDPDWRTH